MKPIAAVVEAKVLKLRLPISGLVTSVNFTLGDNVKKGQVLATLDNTVLKKRQEKELKDYDKMRMQFEETKAKGNSVVLDRLQKDLDMAVLSVEISDWETQHASIVAPADGTIIDDGGFIPGMFASPASFEVKLQVAGSQFVRVEVSQEMAYSAKRDDFAEFQLESTKQIFPGRVLRIFPASEPGQFHLDVILADPSSLLPGSTGNLTIKSA